MRTAVLITPTHSLLAERAGDAPTIVPTPADITDVESLVTRVGGRFFGDHGVILLDGDMATQLGFEDGWRTFGSKPKVYVGRLDQMRGCPLTVSGNLLDNVQSFALFAELLGVPYHRSPGVAGLTLLKSLYPRGKTKRVEWESPGPVGAYEMGYFPSDWSRDDVGRYRHSYDKRRAGLGALNVVEVAREALVHRPNQRTFDPGMAGWWKCEIPAWNDDRMPNPAGYGEGEQRWLTRDTILLLNELAEQGRGPGVTWIWGSWTAPKSRLFQRWADRVETAYGKAELMADAVAPNGSPSELAQDAGRVADAIKQTYREMPGMFDSPDSWVQRPDWFAAKKAIERVNAWRLADEIGRTTGRWPTAVDGDKWTYASDDADAAAAAPSWETAPGRRRGIILGAKLGQWRHQETKEV